jgi:hypothetical protein
MGQSKRNKERRKERENLPNLDKDMLGGIFSTHIEKLSRRLGEYCTRRNT